MKETGRQKARLWYLRKNWYVRSKYQLQEEPFCKMCLDQGKAVLARVADHIEPHDGDETKFRFGKLQSLCYPHHNAAKQQIEHRGYSREIGPDGFPIDQNHPFHRSSHDRNAKSRTDIKFWKSAPHSHRTSNRAID